MFNKLSFDNLFGPSNIEVGEPLNLGNEHKELIKYFEKTYSNSKEPIESIVKKFGLKNSRILSIASGVGAEEILFAQHGNIVECIEPNPASTEVSRLFIDKLGIQPKKIVVHQTTIKNFKSPHKFDFIYTSSPSDWMYSDFRQAIPGHYLDFFNRFASSQCTIMIKIYGACYKRGVLISSWFPKAIASKLSKFSDFRLREYWLTENGRQNVIVATNYNKALSQSNDFTDIYKRSNSKSYLTLKYDYDNPAKYYKYYNLAPYFIVGKYLINKITRKILSTNLFFRKNYYQS